MYLGLKRIDGKERTPGGYQLPLTGEPITNAAVVGDADLPGSEAPVSQGTQLYTIRKKTQKTILPPGE